MMTKFLTVAILGMAMLTVTGCVKPRNISTTECNGGVATVTIPYSYQKMEDQISKLPDGTLVSKGDFDRETLKNMVRHQNYNVPTLTRTIYYNPALSLAINRYDDANGEEKYTSVVLLDPAQKTDIEAEVADVNEVYKKVCADQVKTLDANRNEWLKGLNPINDYMLYGGDSLTSSYNRDRVYLKILKKHFPGLRIEHYGLTRNFAQEQAMKDEQTRRAGGCVGTWRFVNGVNTCVPRKPGHANTTVQVYEGETKIKDPAAALHELLNADKLAAFQADLKEYFASDRYLKKEYLDTSAADDERQRAYDNEREYQRNKLENEQILRSRGINLNNR